MSRESTRWHRGVELRASCSAKWLSVGTGEVALCAEGCPFLRVWARLTGGSRVKSECGVIKRRAEVRTEDLETIKARINNHGRAAVQPCR